jgi:hypothetical protein
VRGELKALIADLHAWVSLRQRGADTVIGRCKLCGIRVVSTPGPWVHESIACTECVKLTPEWFGPADAAAAGLSAWGDDAEDDEDESQPQRGA